VDDGSCTSSEECDQEVDETGANVNLLTGDWVGVRVEESPSKSKQKRRVFFHVACIDRIDDDNFFQVSFLTRHNDHLGAGYMWPLKEDTSNVGREEIVKLNDPIQDIVSAAGSVVRIKLHFDETDIDNARKELNIPIWNIR